MHTYAPAFIGLNFGKQWDTNKKNRMHEIDPLHAPHRSHAPVDSIHRSRMNH